MCSAGCTTAASGAARTRQARAWVDFQITSHILFVLAIMLSVVQEFHEVTLMTSTSDFLLGVVPQEPRRAWCHFLD